MVKIPFIVQKCQHHKQGITVMGSNVGGANGVLYDAAEQAMMFFVEISVGAWLLQLKKQNAGMGAESDRKSVV